MSLYKSCTSVFNWCAKDIDETSLETIVDYVYYLNAHADTQETEKSSANSRTLSNIPPPWF